MFFTFTDFRVSASFEFLVTHRDGCLTVSSYSYKKLVDVQKIVGYTTGKSPDDISESTERVVRGYVFFSLIFDSISIVFLNDTRVWHILSHRLQD